MFKFSEITGHDKFGGREEISVLFLIFFFFLFLAAQLSCEMMMSLQDKKRETKIKKEEGVRREV